MTLGTFAGRADGRADAEAVTRIKALALETDAKVRNEQDGTGSYFDAYVLGLLPLLDQVDLDDRSRRRRDLAIERLEAFIHRREQGRFVTYEERLDAIGASGSGSELPAYGLTMSQGVPRTMHWKGRPLFKTAYDVALYPMILSDIAPRTVLEIGAGSGASAVWLADSAGALGLETHVYSVDLRPPALHHERVTFVRGDCRAVEDVFDERMLRSLPHPFLLIEDAHVNVLGVLEYFHAFLQDGDYVVVEDSRQKQDIVEQLTRRYDGRYKIDTLYCDFFGLNVTCAMNSILRVFGS